MAAAAPPAHPRKRARTAAQERSEDIGRAQTAEFEAPSLEGLDVEIGGTLPPPPIDPGSRRRRAWREREPAFPWSAILILATAAWMLFWAYDRLREGMHRHAMWRLDQP